MNRYQSAEYERCRNNGCCQNDRQNDCQNNGCCQNECGCYVEQQYDSCAEAAVSNASAANNGNGNGCGCGCGCAAAQAAAVEDLPTYACMCAVIAKVNELLAVLRAAGVIDDCD